MTKGTLTLILLAAFIIIATADTIRKYKEENDKDEL